MYWSELHMLGGYTNDRRSGQSEEILHKVRLIIRAFFQIGSRDECTNECSKEGKTHIMRFLAYHPQLKDDRSSSEQALPEGALVLPKVQAYIAKEMCVA